MQPQHFLKSDWLPYAVVACATVFGAASAFPTSCDAAGTDVSMYDSAVRELQRALQKESRWVKVHAAEALLLHKVDNSALSIFEEELKHNSDAPQYRIGIRRVLHNATDDTKLRVKQLDEIRQVYLDKNAPDRGHAAETLGKLQYSIPDADRELFRKLVDGSTDASAPYRRWVLAASGKNDDVRFLAELLNSTDAEIRANTAYSLRFLANKLPADVVSKLAAVAKAEPASSQRVYLISAAYVSARDAEATSRFKKELVQYARDGNKDEKYEVAAALALRGTRDDLPLLQDLLRDAESDVRVSAANAILSIDAPRSSSFRALDWLVLAVYAVGMMAIGWKYSHAATVEEYQLGGREMKPWAVGISLFATLMSTLTYLAYPGEMIRHGPMILSTVLAYPFVYVVVGRYLIPHIMRLKVTSAYEILEMRLGLSVRLLGSSIFLALRLLWMALIVYATSDAIIIPLMGLSASATPWVCIAIAIVTVAYTSMGGLQAVVVTDVIQTFIMLAGAIISLFMISYSLGGVSGWWPHSWSSDWDDPRFFFAADSRASMGMVILSVFTWYVSTAGSDQMAIQRYLSTRNVPAARTMFGISLLCDSFVTVLLAALGLALLAYFNVHSELLPAGETVASSADELLPLFIVNVLPAGLSGLVVAGVLSAAMDSLSSGLNSSALVISEDWINRFRRSRPDGNEQVRQAKVLSWVLGIAVVSISLGTSYVPGNLLEMMFKVVNLLTAPLFVLFFMAMFVPWATAPGTWIGGIASAVVAVGVAYFNWMGLSFIWIMPASLVVGIALGCVASLLPVGMPRPMLQVSET